MLKPVDVTLVVGELRNRGQYNAEDGVSAATLVELFRPAPLVRELPQYLSRVLEISRRRCLRASCNQQCIRQPASFQNHCGIELFNPRLPDTMSNRSVIHN